MEAKRNQQESNFGGEPAIVIDGVPAIIANNATIPPSDASSAESTTVINEVDDIIPSSDKTLPYPGDAASSAGPSGLGKWLVGRKVRKWFEGKYQAGEVTKFDKWYRVLYEDGDSEYLDWQELEEVLVPSEGKVPLKNLAKRITKENKKSASKSGKNVALSQNYQIKKDNTRKLDHTSIYRERGFS